MTCFTQLIFAHFLFINCWLSLCEVSVARLHGVGSGSLFPNKHCVQKGIKKYRMSKNRLTNNRPHGPPFHKKLFC